MQTADKAIKIIKRENRDVVAEKVDLSAKTESEIRREILNTITAWVEDQREAKKEQHRQSNLFKQGSYAS